MRASALFTGLGACAGAGALLGGAILVYGNRVGLTRFTTREVQIGRPRTPDQRPLRILHISDIHYVPGQRKKAEWIRRLAELEPDLVINTGDNLSDHQAGPEVLRALDPLLDLPGVFVPGSNDYYAPKRKNPARYLLGPSQLDEDPVELPWRELFDQLGERGWVNLANRTHVAEVAGHRLEFSGVDDPHIDLDEFRGWPADELGAGAPDAGEASGAEPHGPTLRIGVAHAPVSSALQSFAQPDQASGKRADLVLCGHTHGGQICLPGEHALVTNCDLPRRQAMGLSTVRTPDGDAVPLHVSAGIGTSAKAQVRLNCPPESTLLTVYH